MAKARQTDLDAQVGEQPEDVRRKHFPKEYEGTEQPGKDTWHRGGGTQKAAETIKPFRAKGG